MKNVKSVLLGIYKKLTTFDNKIGVISNGVDNLYPERADRFINNSVTAKTCAKIMTSYLVGKGWGKERKEDEEIDKDKIIVNSNNGLTLQKFTSKIGASFSKQRGVFIHINYNLNYKPSSYDVLPYAECRLGKKDDNKYNGKIGVSDKWDAKNIKNSDITFIDVFNPKESIVKEQINSQKGNSIEEKLKNYKGQVLYVNLDDEYIYALSQIDAVMNDCDSEAQASIFKNRSLRKGFFGKTLVITRPLAGSLEDYNTPEDYRTAVSEQENFTETIQDFIGVEDVGGAMHVEMEYESEDLENAILFKNIDSNIDDKIFSYTESSVFINILMAFNSIPPGLVRPENSVFSSSGESIKQMQQVYQDNTQVERQQLIQTIQYLMSIFYKPVTGLELQPLISQDELTNK